MRKNKKGTTTIFLAIILSALIIVETTYVAFVADLDRRLTYTRALKEQTEVYLASYNRLLFKTYGIYAFDSSTLDSSIFNTVLSANGYEPGDLMYASGIYYFDTEDLRKAVAGFYAYRAPGILVERLSEQIIMLIERIDSMGVYDALRQYASSPGSGMLGRILDGGEEVAAAIQTAMSALGIDGSSSEASFFWSLMGQLGAIRNASPEIGNGFDPVDMGFLLDLMEYQNSIYEVGAGFNEGPALHACLSDYAANNFDTVLEDDTAINGTDFSYFHDDNISDTEYILTGLEGGAGCAVTDYYIFGVLVIKNIISNLADQTMMETIQSAGEILSAVVTVLSAGSVALPDSVYVIVILTVISEIQAVSDLITVLRGDEVTFVEYEGEGIISLDYRDFLTFFMSFVSDENLLNRMHEVLVRDFPDHATGIAVETSYGNSLLTYEREYELYE